MKPIIVGNIADQNFEEVLSFTLISVETSGFLSHKSFNESLAGSTTISLFVFSIPFSITFDPDKVAIALFQSIKISEYLFSEKFCSNTFNAIS
jgi:hypothetical protein